MRKTHLLRLLGFIVCVLGTTTVQAQNNFILNPAFSFGLNGDGSTLPGQQFFDNGFNQRGMAHDPVSGNIVVVDTHTGSSGMNGTLTNLSAIYVINGTTGDIVTTLNTNGIGGGTYALSSAGVADDGVVYICNQVSSSTNLNFKIYRWDSVSSVDPPVLAFNATLAPAQRYGSDMDVRGAGPNTQIIVGSFPNSAAQSGTNVVIFTTVDGTNFNASVIGTDVTSANFNDGVAFGTGDTFWAKRIGQPLRYMSFNLGTKTATTVASYTNIYPNFINLGPLTVDTNNNLLAAIEEAKGTVTGGTDKVWLFDISGTRPVLLNTRTVSTNNQNGTAPMGALSFGGGRLYVHVPNNGLLVSTVDSQSTPPPTFILQPPGTNRVSIGVTAHFEAVAVPNVTSYQWRTNGVPIPGATNTTLDVPNVQVSDSGRIYSVVASNANSTVTSSNSLLSVVNPADLFHLELLWSAAPGATNYFAGTGGGTPTERTMAYNALSNHLYVVRRTGNNVVIWVVNSDTGQFLYTLKTNNIALGTPGGNIPLCAIGVAEDGAIYACNSVAANDPGNLFKVYRWANADSNTVPDLIFGTSSSAASANPAQGVTTAGFRWGDVMDVRGAGTNTQLLFDHQDTTTVLHYAGLLRPTDSTMTNWSAKGFVLQNALGGTVIGRGIQFGEGNTFWQKRWQSGGSPLVESSFDPDGPDPQLASVVLTSTTPPLSTNGVMNINFTLKLGAAINFFNGVGTAPDTLNLYDMTAPETPVFASSYNFPVASVAGGNNRIGQVIFTTNRVFALDAVNGLMAFTIANGPIPPPTFLTQPKNQRILLGGSGGMQATVDQTASFQWRKNGVNVPGATSSVLSILNAQLTNSGNYTLVASNQNGMATSMVATVTITAPSDNYRLVKLWDAPPGTTPYLTSNGGSSTPTERSFGYNALSNQLIVVQCAPASATPLVHVVDASTGAKLYNLRTDNVVHVASEVAGSNPLDLTTVEVASDGAVYICNEVPNAAGGTNFDAGKMFYVYRWANSDSNTVPTPIFLGDPAFQTSNFRWGDSMNVRGSGTNTEILLDSNDGGSGALLKPADSSLTSFTNIAWTGSGGAGSIGRSLQFHTNNTIWQKRKAGSLFLSSFDTNAHTSSVIGTFNNFTNSLGGVAVNAALNLAAGVEFIGVTSTSPDAVGLYEITDGNTPVLIGRYNFPVNQTANANFIGKTIFAGNRVFSLDGNNGMVAFTIVGPQLSIASVGPNVVISWSTNITGTTLQGTTSISPATWTNILGSPVIVGDRYTVTQSATNGIVDYRLNR